MKKLTTEIKTEILEILGEDFKLELSETMDFKLELIENNAIATPKYYYSVQIIGKIGIFGEVIPLFKKLISEKLNLQYPIKSFGWQCLYVFCQVADEKHTLKKQ